jgi:outer membrane protein OmpU
MNKLKKIGLTALSASLVAISANAGEMSVTGSAKIASEGFSGEAQDAGTTFSMGNQLTFSGSGELDNGLNVSLKFVLDQGDNTLTNGAKSSAPFDSHSVSIGSDTLGTLTFNGEGGTTASSAISGTAAGDLWDAFDQVSYDGTNNVTDLAQTASAGDNSMIYTSPELVDGLTLVGSYQPQGGNRESGTGFGVNYNGVEGLSLSYADTDVVGTTALTSGDNTVIKASYAYGPVTVGYSQIEHDEGTTDGSGDVDMTSYALSYSISESLSVTVGTEESSIGTAGKVDAEIDGITASYTAGGMTLSASRFDGENLDYTTSSDEDMEYWAISASFAF